jgi:hypothetical protein
VSGHHVVDVDQVVAAAVKVGVCAVCAAAGQVALAADPAGTRCQYHLRMAATARTARRPAPPLVPVPRPGRRKAGVQGWHRQFLRCSPVKKMPRRTGSRRRCSPQRVEDHAARIVAQAVAARRTYRPVAWLALVIYDLETNRPAGASRVDARANATAFAAVLAADSDWRSGHRARPGRQVAAGIIGRSEKTIERHAALLERRALIRRDSDGDLLDADARALAQADPDASPAQRFRWADRAEWSLLIPDWVRELTDEQIWPYIVRAAALLDELAAPARPARVVDNPVDAPVDNAAGQRPNTGSVAPPIGVEVLTSLPIRRSSFSCPPTVDKPPAAPSPVLPPKQQTGGASRLSPAKVDPGSGKSRLMPGVARLARHLVADNRFPFVRREEDLGPIAGILHRRGLGRWTPDDVAAEVGQRLAECGKTMLAVAAAPASYLDWLLKDAVAAEPPAQIAAAAAQALRTERTTQARAWAARTRAAVPAPASPGGREARRLADALAAREHDRRLTEARERDEQQRRHGNSADSPGSGSPPPDQAPDRLRESGTTELPKYRST